MIDSKSIDSKSRLVAWLQASFLICIGCLQLTGDLLNLPSVKALGAITHASPAPKVFTSQEGYETYTPKFFVVAHPESGPSVRKQLTPELNGHLRGPYNRRNAYGAALSYGPVLVSNPKTRPMFESSLLFALCGPSGLAEEVGLPNVMRYTIEIVPQSDAASPRGSVADYSLTFQVSCIDEEVISL